MSGDEVLEASGDRISKQRATTRTGGDRSRARDPVVSVDRRDCDLKYFFPVLLGLKRRDLPACVAIREKHIDRRLDQITTALKEGYAQIYMAREAGASGLGRRK